MTEDTLAHAFDPFFTTKSIGEGSGLGLPQAYGFARQSGGLLTLESRPGAGTVACFYLPRASNKRMAEWKGPAEPAGSSSQLPDAAYEQGSTEEQGGPDEQTAAADALPVMLPPDEGSVASTADPDRLSPVILLVEDDALVRDVVGPALAAAGFTVRLASSGEEALHCLASGEAVDLVFSDIVMPGSVSGIELTHWIQQHQPGLQVVLATGYTEQRLALPGVPVLAKPYDMDVVVQVLHTALMRSQTPHA